MSRSAIYFILILFAVYFAFVTGRILADIDISPSEVQATEDLDYHGYASGKARSLSDYLNPFSGFDPSDVHYSEEQEYTYHKIIIPSSGHSSDNIFEGFATADSENGSSHAVAGSGEGSGGTYIRSSGSGRSSGDEDLSFGPGYSNPFGGLIVQLERTIREQSADESGNPTGTFGMKLGVTDNFETLSPGSPGGLEPIPLDSGVYFLLGACLFAAGYFIYRQRSRVV